MSDNYVLDILLSEDNNYMGTGFTKQQWQSLCQLCGRSPSFLPLSAPPAPPSAPPAALQSYSPPPELPPAPISAPPAALPPCVPTLSELPPQPTSAPVPAPSYPPSPSVETIEEVEQEQIYKPLRRNIRQMRKKLGASKKVPTSQLPFNEICIRWPTTFGRSSLLFSRDEDLDAWYTTMLNSTQKLAI